MLVENRTTAIKREILQRIATLCFEGRLVEDIDKLPLHIIPRDNTPHRCCIHKDRALVKYRTIALLGFSLEDEMGIDSRALSQFAKEALGREKPTFPILTFIDDACRNCVRSSYAVTDVCRNCVAKLCVENCPKGAVSIRENRVFIEESACINCGKCFKICPFHAIVFVPVPCETACPVGAIARNASGTQSIDYDKCIFCGKCILGCPFGAVMEKSWIVDVISQLRGPRDVVALLAPSIFSQFEGSPEQIVAGLKKLGFSHVVEVALGADITADDEAAELQERLALGDGAMGTSCCPAYLEAVKKHVPEFAPRISHAPTPMSITGKFVGERCPGALRVFIGPCVAKKHEDLACEQVEYVLTFEELAAMLSARAIVPAELAPEAPDFGAASPGGRGFALAGGVSRAVQQRLGAEGESKTVLINGLGRDGLRMLKHYATSEERVLVEVMSCEGGCLCGPSAVERSAKARQRMLALGCDGGSPRNSLPG